MKISLLFRRVKGWFADLPVGGAWGRTLPVQPQKALRWLWFDGLFASASDNIILNFISLYILALGGTQVQVGLMSSLSSFTGAFLLLIGAVLAERIGRHKEITLLAGGTVGRLCILLLIFVPILFKGTQLVWIAIALSVLRDGSGNLGYPSWMSVINQTVPIEGRGRYFGSRNFVMGVTGMMTTLLAGELITHFVHQTGYQIALAIAFVCGIASTFSFARIDYQVPSADLARPVPSLRSFFRQLKGRSQFLVLVLTAAVWNFAINVSGPFFNPHMVKDLNFSASQVGILAVITSLSGLVFLNRMGSLSDRFGPRKLQLVSMALIPTLPLMWIFATRFWHVALINVWGGVTWAAFNLSVFNLMLNAIPKDQVARYSAFYQIMVTLSLAFGALAGSAVIDRVGFTPILIASTVIRLIAVLLFVWLVHEPVKKSIG